MNPESERNIHILLVEDDDVDREAVVRNIRRSEMPYSLRTAASENEALDALKKEDFDVVLLDYNLGTATGLDILPYAGTTPVIFVTGSGTESVAVEAMRRGACDYLIKDPERNYLTVLPLTISSVLARRQAEKELKHLRHLLDNIVNSMPSILVSVDREGRVTRWNREAEKITGITAVNAQGLPLREVFPQLAGQMDNVRKAVSKGEQVRSEMVAGTDDEQRFLWELTIYPLIDGDVEGAVIRVDDVTEKIRLETMMIHSEKMVSVGGLAAGMAHELNNPLAGILHNAQVVRSRISDQLPKNRRVAEECGISLESIRVYMERRGIFDMIEAIMDSGRTAARIVENLLGFSRRGDEPYVPQDITKLLDNAVYLVGSDYEMKKKYNFQGINIVREYHTPLPPIPCEPGKIQQVFFNIIKNGARAMTEACIESPRFILRVLPVGDTVRIQVEDNGPGMDESVRKRVFDPFFTTRDVGQGTGLGLSTSYFIITHHHRGSMTVESTPGKGTVFTIRLPLAGRGDGQGA